MDKTKSFLHQESILFLHFEGTMAILLTCPKIFHVIKTYQKIIYLFILFIY